MLGYNIQSVLLGKAKNKMGTGKIRDLMPGDDILTDDEEGGIATDDETATVPADDEEEEEKERIETAEY